MRTAVKRKKETLDWQCSKQRRDSLLPSPSATNNSTLTADSPFAHDMGCRKQQPEASHVEATDKTEQLRQLLDRELNESRSFETYLQSIIDNVGPSSMDDVTVSCRSVSRDRNSREEFGTKTFYCDALNISGERTLTDRLEQLNAAVSAERNADRLFEMQLMNILIP